jgi:hypothetical protein
VPPHDPIGDGEAETAARAAGIPRAEETVQDMIDIFTRNADPTILEGDPDVFAIGGARNPKLAAIP